MSARPFLVLLLTYLLTSSLTQLSPSYLVRQVGPSPGSRKPMVHLWRVEDFILWTHPHAWESSVSSLCSCSGTHIWPPLVGRTEIRESQGAVLGPLCPLHVQQLLWQSSHHSQMLPNIHMCFPLIQSKLLQSFKRYSKCLMH